ncbi:MAG: DUF559 domain-containing protein [Acidobacteria bacterium]|nr:MAG: DUF559 domain-containing protein [Acidobacteriota bacterium]GIK78881.1 MAG: hypothetical protein BroJett022_25710 [Actinomycetes bacterium]
MVALSQLVRCGFTAAGVASLVQGARLHRVHREVYSPSPAELGGLGLRMAAVLAGGPGSLLASRSAAGHFELITVASSRIDVMSPRQIRRPGIRAHRMASLEPQDRVTHLGIPCTSVARTLLDVAAVGRPGELADALDQSVAIGIFDLYAIEDVIARNGGRRGVRRLRSATASLRVEGHFRSEFERRFLPIVRAAGLPEPLVNHTITLDGGTIEVDFCWPDVGLVVETDGYRFHSDIRSFRKDRRRDRRLLAAGFRCLRFVWSDLDRPDAIGRELVAIHSLAARLQKPAPRAG